MDEQKCCVKGCERRGIPQEGFDFYVCTPCLDELERLLIEMKVQQNQQQLASKHNFAVVKDIEVRDMPPGRLEVPSTKQQLATAQQELAAKTKAHDEECEETLRLTSERDKAEQQLQTALEQQARLREVILWLLGEKGEFPDRPEKVEGKIQPLYWWRTELRKRFEALQATPTGNAFDARAAVVELADVVIEEVERVDEYGYTLINGEAKYQRAVELKQQAQG